MSNGAIVEAMAAGRTAADLAAEYDTTRKVILDQAGLEGLRGYYRERDRRLWGGARRLEREATEPERRKSLERVLGRVVGRASAKARERYRKYQLSVPKPKTTYLRPGVTG